MNAAASGVTRAGRTVPLGERFEGARLDWIVPEWEAPDVVQAFVTTRNGGVSEGAHASLDLGSATAPAGPMRESIGENRRRVQAFLPSTPVWLDQTHGTDVAIVEPSRRPASDYAPSADAAVTRAADIVLAVRVADCLPVLLSDRTGAVIGVAHAGWRGLAGGVLENVVAAMACEPDNVVAWLGPAIGATAFEVGDDVRDAFLQADRGAAPAFIRGRPRKWHADLAALARRRLARAGVGSVAGGGPCTVSNQDRFFSYRRDGTTGRMAAFVWRTGA